MWDILSTMGYFQWQQHKIHHLIKVISGYILKYILNGNSCEGKDHEFYSYILKQKCCHFDEILVTGWFWNTPCVTIRTSETCIMTSSNGNIFCITGHFCGEFTGHKDQWRGALMFSLICVWINGWENNHEAGDLRCHCAHYDVIVMGGKHVVRTTNPIDITVTLQWAPWLLKSQHLDYLLNHLFRITSKKTSKLHVTGLCEGNPPVTGGFPSQRASNG